MASSAARRPSWTERYRTARRFDRRHRKRAGRFAHQGHRLPWFCACAGGGDCFLTGPSRAERRILRIVSFHPAGQGVLEFPGASAPQGHFALKSCFHFLLHYSKRTVDGQLSGRDQRFTLTHSALLRFALITRRETNRDCCVGANCVKLYSIGRLCNAHLTAMGEGLSCAVASHIPGEENFPGATDYLLTSLQETLCVRLFPSWFRVAR